MEDLPFSIANRTLQLDRNADRVTVYSLSGRVILHEKNISSLVLEVNEPVAILSIQMGDTLYRYKYVNF
jgi:hypothetical protein